MCPYCLDPQAFTTSNKCEKCGRLVSQEYIRNAQGNPPIWLVTFGTTQHGKTTFINSMTSSVENLGKIIPGTYHKYLDDHTRDKIRDIHRFADRGDIKREMTNLGEEPLLIHLSRHVTGRPNTLVIYDLAGELSENPEKAREYAAAIKYTQVVWFIVSLYDLMTDVEGRRISDLIDFYEASLEKHGASIQGRDVLVIYTKADLDIPDLRFPQDVLNYLRQDPYLNLAKLSPGEKTLNINQYIEDEIDTISKKLRQFTIEEVPEGLAFINRIEDSGAKISFAIVSALGAPANQQGQVGTINRYRVIDPLLWALKRGSGRESHRSVALLLDASSSGGYFFAQNLPQRFHDALTTRGLSVTTYYLGRVKPAYQVGKRPSNLIAHDDFRTNLEENDETGDEAGSEPSAISSLSPTAHAPRDYMRLVGPILDSLPESTLAIAILGSDATDLNDFLDTTWIHRLLVVTQSRDVAVEWPSKALLDEYGDAVEALQEFLLSSSQE
jgi:hypothetical protein